MGRNTSIYTSKQKKAVLSSLDKLGFVISRERRKKIVKAFIKDLKASLQQKKSSLQVKPSFFYFSDALVPTEDVAVLEFGKTELVKSIFTYNDNKVSIHERMSYPMPGLYKELSVERFFKDVIKEVRDILRTMDRVGISVRHPVLSQPEGEAILLEWARGGVQAPLLVGQPIAGEFREVLEYEFEKDYEVYTLNDTVATLLSGLSLTLDREFEDFIGIVHGQGYNLAYIENVKNIKGVDFDKNKGKEVVVDIEAGAFDFNLDSKVDAKVEKKLKNLPMGNFSRKINSTALPVILKTLISTIPRSVIDEDVKKNFEDEENIDLEQMKIFLKKGLKADSKISALLRNANFEQASNLAVIVESVIQRAAVLVAIQICGILEYKDIGHNPLQPVGILIDGEFSEIVCDLSERVRCQILDYFEADDQRFVKIINIPQSSLIGTGIAASLK